MTVVLPITQDDGEGGSLLTTIEINEHPGDIGGSSLLISDPISAERVLLLDTIPETKDESRYTPPNRQLAVILAGTIEVEDDHGHKQQFHPGDAAIAADTEAGHTTRLINKPARVLLIDLVDN
jgi:hypothetical protein